MVEHRVGLTKQVDIYGPCDIEVQYGMCLNLIVAKDLIIGSM